jgi:hypothetical protein
MSSFLFDTGKYGPVFSGLIDPGRLNNLGPGSGIQKIPEIVRSNNPGDFFGHTRIINNQAALACLAGLALHYDLLEESHRISQMIATASGSFWHGIMHRREGDYGNSKYWFRQVGKHPAFSILQSETDRIDDQNLLNRTAWDPFKFIDLCESAAGSGERTETFCKNVQRIEWQILFDFCYDLATKSE